MDMKEKSILSYELNLLKGFFYILIDAFLVNIQAFYWRLY